MYTVVFLEKQFLKIFGNFEKNKNVGKNYISEFKKHYFS